VKTQTKPNTREGLKPVMVYLSPTTKKALQLKAINTDTSMSQIIVDAIERAVRQ